MYAVNDKITLAASRGGWSGYVSEVLNGPGGTYLYRVFSQNPDSIEEGSCLASEDDIAAGPLTPPTFSLNQLVTLYGTAGTIVAVNADNTFDIEVEHRPTDHLTLTRNHAAVPLWRVAIENQGA